MTPGYLEHILTKELGKAFAAVAREDRALYFCIDDPFVAPHFFVLNDEGWQIDLAAEAREVININGGLFSWSLRDPQRSVWLKPFSEQIIFLDSSPYLSQAATQNQGGVRRLQGGDNRAATLPTSTGRQAPRRSQTESPT
jgi:hypothetical protein